MLPENSYEASFFALRSALLPVEDFARWPERATEAAQERHSGPCSREELRRELNRILDQPEAREAIYLASPSLSTRRKDWREAPRSKKGRRIEEPLVRYFARMAGRSTPFGLFAGCSVGELGEETSLELPPRGEYRKQSRLDMAFVTRMSELLLSEPAAKRNLRYRVNSVLRQIGETYRYAEQRGTGARRTFHLVEVPADDILDSVIREARHPATYSELVDSIAGDGVSQDEASAFLDELIGAQILEPCGGISVTGPDPRIATRATLDAFEAPPTMRSLVGQVLDELETMDEAGLGQDPSRYRAMQAQLEQIDPDLDASRLFQVDMVKPTSRLTLSRDACRRIREGTVLLYQLFGNSRDPFLERFATQFHERYGDTFQPLPLVLDEEDGIGFGDGSEGMSGDGELVRGLGLAKRIAATPPPILPIYSYLLRRMNAQGFSDDPHEIQLTDGELEGLAPGVSHALPNAFAVVATAYECPARGRADVKTHEFQVQVAIGPSGARMLGRFCHADPILARKVEQHLSAEARLHPDAILAEIVHMPAGRVGNVLTRPAFHGHEIPVLASPGAEGVIALDDLLVGVRGSRIILLHRQSGREVLPRSTTAHNFDQPGVAAYRFLCHLQAQGKALGAKWNWGPLAAMGRLPRIRYGSDVILCPRTWFLRRGDLDALCTAAPHERMERARRLREEWKLPRHVSYVEGDNTLPIDLENPLSIDSLARVAAKNSLHHLEEVYGAYGNLAVKGPEGRFAHEIVLPFVRTEQPKTRAGENASMARQESLRAVAEQDSGHRHGLGSDWLFAKLYGGRSTVDAVVAEQILPLVRRWKKLAWIDGWFFIRYADPQFHLRFRVQVTSPVRVGEILEDLNERLGPLIDSRRIWKTCLDTYEPETTRYGGELGISIAERLFALDSELAVRICAATQSDERLASRWKWALCTADSILRMALTDPAARRSFVAVAKEGYGREYDVVGPRKRRIRDRFRRERKELEALLAGEGELAAWIRPHLQFVTRMNDAFRKLRRLEADGVLAIPYDDVLASVLHMHFNRVLSGDARAQEMVLYHYLDLLYASEMARNKSVGASQSVGG